MWALPDEMLWHRAVLHKACMHEAVVWCSRRGVHA
jgi:hypothetical protein